MVSRTNFKTWNPSSWAGKMLLDACIDLVNAPEREREDRETGVEALSVLCMKFEACAALRCSAE